MVGEDMQWLKDPWHGTPLVSSGVPSIKRSPYIKDRSNLLSNI
jgi:hypothetical protein